MCQLIDAQEDTLLWSETYDRDLQELPQMLREIASQVAEEYRFRLTAEEQRRLSGRTTARGNAFESHLRGRYFLERRTVESITKAMNYFRAALGDDPSFAPAYVGLAECYTRLGAVEVAVYHPREARALALGSAKQALALDPDSTDARASLAHAYLYDWEWEECQKAVRQALEANPSCVPARITNANRMTAIGRFDDALREIAVARELDPLSLSLQSTQASTLKLSRQFQAAIAAVKRLVDTEPGNADFHGQLGAVYLGAGQHQNAISAYETALRLSKGRFTYLGFQAQAYAAAGERKRAVATLDELLEMQKHRYVTPCLLALIYLSLDKKTEFYRWYEKSFEERANGMLWTKVEALYDPVRQDSRFQAIQSRIFRT